MSEHRAYLLDTIDRLEPYDVYRRCVLGHLVKEVRGSQGVIAREHDGSEWVELNTAWALMRATNDQIAEAMDAAGREQRTEGGAHVNLISLREKEAR
jgi:hypothetical protein